MTAPRDWPAEAIHEWHERVGIKLDGATDPADIARAEAEAREEMERSGRLMVLRRMKRRGR